jgi:hypothetical protein
MNTKTFTLQLCLLALTLPAWGQTPPVASEARTARPLNLSLPKDVIRSTPTPFMGDVADDTVARNLRPESGRLPYGSGYEARQRESNSGAGAGWGNGDGGRGTGAGTGSSGRGSGASGSGGGGGRGGGGGGRGR